MIRPVSRHVVASVLVATAALSSSLVARADVAAPEYCPAADSVGQSCSTAGPNFDQEGICEEVACDGGGPCGLICELAPDAGPTNPPDAGPIGMDDAGPTPPPPDDAGPTPPPPNDAGPTPPPTNEVDSGTTTLPDAGTTPDAGTNTNGANGKSSLNGASGCSSAGAGAGSAGGLFFLFGALGLLLTSARRRKKA